MNKHEQVLNNGKLLANRVNNGKILADHVYKPFLRPSPVHIATVLAT